MSAHGLSLPCQDLSLPCLAACARSARTPVHGFGGGSRMPPRGPSPSSPRKRTTTSWPFWPACYCRVLTAARLHAVSSLPAVAELFGSSCSMRYWLSSVDNAPSLQSMRLSRRCLLVLRRRSYTRLLFRKRTLRTRASASRRATRAPRLHTALGHQA